MSSYFLTTTFGNPTGNRFFPSPPGVDDEGGCRKVMLQRLGYYEPLVTMMPEKSDETQHRPTWIVGSSNSTTDAQFLLVNDNDTLQRVVFNQKSSALDNISVLPQQWPSTRPLVATESSSPEEESFLLTPFIAPESTSKYSGAIPIIATESTTPPERIMAMFISQDRKLMLHDNSNDVSKEIDPAIEDVLIDGNIVYSTINKMYATYSGSTSQRYVHGVLGNNEEGYKLNILMHDSADDTNNNDEIKLVTTVELPGDSLVYEGLNPIWADVDGDGVEDLVTTVALDGKGAALRVYLISEEGTIRSESTSEFIGTSGRWLHQLGVGPLGPFGEREIIVVRTPHFDGHVRYYRYDTMEDRLENVADFSQYTSHDIGSRNLDRAIIGDFNNDGIPEVVIQDQAEEALFGLQRSRNSTTGEEAHIVWKVDLPSPLYSNIALSCTEEGGPQLFFSTSDSSLVRIQFVSTDEPPPECCSGGYGKPLSVQHNHCLVAFYLTLLLVFWIRKGR